MRTQKRVVGSCAAAALIGMWGCTDRGTPVQPSAASSQAVVAQAAHDDTAAQAPAALNHELATVRQATAAFHNPDAAAASGYLFFAGEPCVEGPAGTMGIHVLNPGLVATQALDPMTPELLVYLPKPGGGLRLVAVEYLQVVLLRNPATGQVGPWTSSSPWPSTYEVVTPAPQLFGQSFQGPMPGHAPGMAWHWDLHVWLWQPNPSGMFAQWNPAISCAA